MNNLFVFAGTTEGRDFTSAFLEGVKKTGSQEAWRVHVFTATEYGGELLQDSPEMLEIHTGRLDADGIFQALVRHKPAYTVDCTHPHAREISLNLQAACARADCRYLRLRRGAVKLPPGLHVREADTLEEAADFLRTQEGTILLATGSKELSPFALPELRERVFVRVLPLEESIRVCKTLGFQTKNTIAMQGPFSEAMNRALLQDTRASWLVTKDSGTEGGLAEKLSAAAQEGVAVIMIRRPDEPEALSLEEMLSILLPDSWERKIVYLIGAGGGSKSGMTGDALRAIKDSRCIIGSPRLLAGAEPLITGKPRYALTAAAEIIACIAQQDEPSIGILFSGDSGFYSGAKRLIPLLRERGWRFAVIPGVSSLSYFAAKLGLSWEDAKIVSLHGRTANILSSVIYHPKTFFLTGGETSASALCKILNDAGLGDLTLHIGERLSYPDERLTAGTAASLEGQRFDSLSVVMVENPSPRPADLGNYSLPDSAFTRGAVPMTKEEIRAVSLSKLRMKPDSIAWDIGAGTGSVACEMALKAKEGWVYAVEQNPDALDLIEENRKKLGIFNLTAVPGTAPDALEALPAPDRVFIGGSSGKLEPILSAVLAKNPLARVVINGITLETANAGASLLKKYALKDADIVQIAVARAEPAGNAHLMKALNPVFIISGG
jgi:precorrin-6Y C5,15-methyltransferase (decarboxylating)